MAAKKSTAPTKKATKTVYRPDSGTKQDISPVVNRGGVNYNLSTPAGRAAFERAGNGG